MKATPALATLVVIGTASAPLATARAPCRGVHQLRDLLLHSDTKSGDGDDSTAALLEQCVAPLLLLPNKWAGGDGDGWAAYCAQSVCAKAVKRLRALPTCTWTAQLPSDAERELLVAQRVMTDCGGF